METKRIFKVGGKTNGAGKPRQIIVRFVSRQSVHLVFRNKKNLALMEKYKNIFITDDLTQLRMKLKSVLKETVGVSRFHSRDGNLRCQKDGKQYTVATPDDLHVLGIEVDLKRLGLEALE
ncbi:hypothetical protein MAR_007892 [Mya arenaria]|uniref:Uncharacterized protein n=1 Tax=Mya arenaria TaxID=6604 RepID=A0ABY7DWQ3_MYAAR|nr:hypothetical protein MAR_007892 [Mya arenaria]